MMPLFVKLVYLYPAKYFIKLDLKSYRYVCLVYFVVVH